MKKLTLLILLTLLPLLAQAGHHRDHAAMHLDNSLKFLDASLAIAERSRDNPANTDLASAQLNKYLIYAGKYRNRIAAARELLLTGGDLEEIRRLISAPGMNGERESADYGVAATVSILAAALREGADTYQMSFILTRHSKADQFLGWAHWHVIDAIREETYQDPGFICSGANNHCE